MNNGLRCRILIAIAGIVMPSTPVVAQNREVARGVTAQDIARHMRALAEDSGTAKPAIEKTARYIADQFKDIGLLPGGHNSSWFQRYPTRVSHGISDVYLRTGGQEHRISVGGLRQGYIASEAFPWTPIKSGMILVSGRHTVRSIDSLLRGSMQDQVALYVPPSTMDSVESQDVVDRLAVTSKLRGIVVLKKDSVRSFRRHVQAVRLRWQEGVPLPIGHDQETWVLCLLEGAMHEVLLAGDLNLATLRANEVPAIRELPAWKIRFMPQIDWFDREDGKVPTAPNVVGVLPGSDPVLRREHVLFLAHMDQASLEGEGVRDRTNDNVSGIAGLVEVARAFGQPGARPRRSTVFVAVSGGRANFWGSNYVAQRLLRLGEALRWLSPGEISDVLSSPGGLWKVVLVINLDGIGRGKADSITLDGLTDLELPVPLEWITAGHPELGLALVRGGTAMRPESDHFRFFVLGVPALSVHDGAHGRRAEADNSRIAVDSDFTARVSRLVFYIGQSVANADEPPKWSLAGRQRFLDMLKEAE